MVKTVRADKIMPGDRHRVYGEVKNIRVRNDGRSIDIFFQNLYVGEDKRPIPMFCVPSTMLEME